MKISALIENVTPTSTPDGNNPSSAPKFGRDPKVLEMTTSGVISTAEPANLGTQRRGTGALFKGIKTSKKFVNSPMTEDDISEEQLLDKTVRKELFNKAKDKDIGRKPASKEIMPKTEGKDSGEYDMEGDFVKTQIHTIVRVMTHLEKKIGDDENLPEWVQMKISQAQEMLVSVMDYVISQKERDHEDEVDIEGMYEEQLDELKCWSGYHRVKGVPAGAPGSCAKNKGVAEAKPQKKADRYHINKDGKPATLASYKDKESAIKDRDAKYPGAKVHQVGPRGKVKGEFEEGVAEGSQRVDSLVTNSLKIMKGPTIDDAITALKTVLGDREYNSRREFYSFYIKQLMNMYGQQGVAEAVNFDRKKNPNYPNDPASQKHHLDTAKSLLSDPKTDPDSRKAAAAIVAKQEKKDVAEEKCPHCNGPMFAETLMNEKKDACYYKVKSRYKVWPSAYASGALVKCRKSHGKWGTKSESIDETALEEEWSEKYKRSIDCNNPKGFSQKAHCQGRKKK